MRASPYIQLLRTTPILLALNTSLVSMCNSRKISLL
uniref:Uncharacterized protein n=1 Tax=Anguilla anguilla TaxID=7936 RepID=A0A0E9REV5_ANGAN